MSLINDNSIKYFKRNEEKIIYEKICNLNIDEKGNEIIMYGESGVGKTTIVNSVIDTILSLKEQSKYQVLYYDASKQIPELTKENFYNSLIYKTLTEKKCSPKDKTKIDKTKTFISYLDKSSYKESIKNNIKQSLILSLSLVPYIGSTINNILSIDTKDFKQIYFDNSNYFVEYINKIAKSGLIFIFDNANYIPEELLNELCSQIDFDSKISLILINSIDDIQNLTYDEIKKQKYIKNTYTITINKISFEEFKEICKDNFSLETYEKMARLLKSYYMYVEYGNFRLIDEFYFRITNLGLESINDSPLIENIYDMDEIKQNILDLLTIFSSSVKEELINKIISLNDFCEKEKVEKSLSELVNNKYIVKNENSAYGIEHNKIITANYELSKLDDNQERHMELYNSCKEILTKELYEDISDADFVFCITELLKINNQFDIVKHIGIISKYIKILDMKYKYLDICMLINRIIDNSNDINIVLLFPIGILVKVLNAYQKTSNFANGYKLAEAIHNSYDITTYMSKFKLQMYNYDESIEIIKQNLNSYEAWNVYLNALQHMRKDEVVKKQIENLKNKYPEYYDEEYYIIILRNSGHLFSYKDSLSNLEKCIEYFTIHDNQFALSTCYNNIGLVHLYNYDVDCNEITISKNYFKKARNIMKELHSKEEYQSLFNIGLTYLCENNYTLAESYFDKSINITPQVLTFDLEKFICTKYLCQMFNNKIDAIECRDLICDHYLNIESQNDPWIKYMFDYNIEALNSIINNCEPNYNSIIKSYCGNPYKYGLNYTFRNDKFNIKFIMAVSPHWRY